MPKSFSGCLNCRRLKIKCDQGAPSCEHCRNTKISCEYASNLRWSVNDRSVLRRPVEKAEFPLSMRFAPREVHEILDSLDRAEQTSGTCIGPFTVFSVSELTQLHQCPSNQDQQDDAQARENSSIPHFPQLFRNLGPAQDYDTPATLPIPLSEEGSCDKSIGTPSSGESSQIPSVLGGCEILREDLVECFSEGFSSQTPGQDAEALLFERAVELSWPISQVAKHMSFETMRLTALAQALLVYTTQVFTPDNSVRASSGNLWCTFFTPPALSAIGEIVATGNTTTTKYAVLCAVLSCGASRARQSFRPESLEFTFCASLGQRLYDGSRYWIGVWLETHSPGKYKDGLVALITLIMAQFISEDEDRREKTMCTLQRVVNRRLEERPKVSNKASILHRAAAMPILLSRVATGFPKIQNNDSLDSSSWINSAYADSFSAYEDTFSSIADRLIRHESRLISLTHLQDATEIQEYIEQNIADIPQNVYGESKQKSEFSYGLPPSLIFLFKEAVMLSEISEKEASRLSSDFIRRSAMLEAALANWERAYEPPVITIPVGEDSPAAMEARWSAIASHNTFAFYDGILLFHYCTNKDANYALFQTTVRRIIDNLESITCLNVELRERITVPILFPGFVGACMAVESDSKLCSRYDSWLRNMDTFSIYPRGNLLNVVTELRRRRRHGQRCHWSTIVREQQSIPNMF